MGNEPCVDNYGPVNVMELRERIFQETRKSAGLSMERISPATESDLSYREGTGVYISNPWK